jgi:TatD DNase family protein
LARNVREKVVSARAEREIPSKTIRGRKTGLHGSRDAISGTQERSGLKYSGVAMAANVRFIDSHVHLTDYSQVETLVQYSVRTGTRLVSAATDKQTSRKCLDLGTRYGDVVDAFIGVHPSEVGRNPSLAWLEEAAMGATGLGEIGLDPRYSEVSEESRQMRSFMLQLQLAEKLGKPIQVHTRGAEGICLEKLASYRIAGVLLHWFEGETLASAASERGYYVSFGPALLYSRKLARMAGSYPEDLILTESDGPVSFAPLGGRGGPYLIPSVVFRLAEIRRRDFWDMGERISRNGSSYLSQGRRKKG